ncbi:MAG TPA: OmpA family protein [Gemmatimonadaceae bacterium]|nr:OmpA family protein [Gemmatimonadaceae bacterium]
MRSKTILSISLLSFAALSSACSRNKVAAAPTPATSSDRAAIDAADRENAKRADADRAGSERVEAEKTLASDRSAITTPVFFQFDRSEITDEGIRQLDQKVDALQRNPSVRIRVEGNADDSGSDEYNMALSQRRAGIVNRYLTERGIDASRVQIVSYGEEKPACTTSRDDDCRAKNRRDEFVILSGL